ncbi:MAG: hypothetical protein AAFY41_09260 [Bacteroidota bacterium]
MTKTTKYLLAVFLLLSVNLWFFLSKKESSAFKKEFYFEKNDLEQVDQFSFINLEDTINIKRSEGRWIINDRYQADENFVNTLISILEKVEVSKNINNWPGSILGSVLIKTSNESIYQFQFSANPTRTKSYFIEEGVAKEVAVSGYRDQIIDLFDLHSDQWRDRLMIDGSWRTIQQLDVRGIEGAKFSISFDGTFFQVNGEAPQDSSEVVDYLNQFQQFQANEMISPGRFTALDSLSKTVPIATILVEDLKYEEKIQFQIFPSLRGQRFHLVKKSDTVLAVIDERRIKKLLTNPLDVN